MYLALYRAYRPEIFSEVIGQEHIVKILKNQIKAGSTSHAYLFCGTRGTGKTTTARILAKGVNCTGDNEKPCGACENCKAIKDGIFIDVIEIDAASNNGVDNIRELRESVKYPPAAGRKKVYIIDEVHMLSSGAFNALLKTLEEPPEYVMFILATTEPRKLPATILSRCMRLDFRRVPEAMIKERMQEICGERGVLITDSALSLIAIAADGSVRDGLSLLDQCAAPGISEVTREDVLDLIGAAGEEVFLEIAEDIKNGRTDKALLALDKALSGGKDARQFIRDLSAHYRNLLITKFIKSPEDILNVSSENAERIKRQSEGISLADINRALVEISKTAAEAKWSTQPRILLELCVVMLSEKEPEAPAPAARKEPEAHAPEPAPAPKPLKAEGDLWDSLFFGEDGLKGSFNVIRGGAKIASVSGGEYVLSAQSDFVREFIEKNKRAIEELLEKRTGAAAVVKCVNGETKNDGKGEKPIEELTAEIGGLLGLEVEIEEE